MRRPRAPEGLGEPGLAFWRGITKVYELSPAEEQILAQSARIVDLLARIDGQLVDEDLVTVGSTGQPKANPLLSASADQRRLLDGLLRSLALPMPDETAGRRRSPQQREAAQARWRQQREARVG